MAIKDFLSFFDNTNATIINTLSLVWERLSSWTLANWFSLLGDNTIVNTIINILNSISIGDIVLGQITMFDLMFSFLSIVIIISFVKWIVNLIP